MSTRSSDSSNPGAAAEDEIHPASAESGAAPEAIAPPPVAAPSGFVRHEYERSFRISSPRARVWRWLEEPETFVRGQLWPFRVEFVSADPDVPPGFHVGGLNIHHGPLMSFAGILTEIREGTYRDLRYFYGSYVIGLRFIRPTRLEFELWDAPDGGTDVTLRVTSFVRRWLAGVWTLGQRAFWSRFPRWMAGALDGRVVG